MGAKPPLAGDKGVWKAKPPALGDLYDFSTKITHFKHFFASISALKHALTIDENG